MKKNSFVKKYYKIITILMLLVLVIVLPTRKPSFKQKTNYYNVNKISKLAMTEVVYHNVAIVEEESIGILKFAKYGYKKVWIEYEGTIEYGVDAKKIKIYNPDKNGVVKVRVPKAEIVGGPHVVKGKIKDPIIDTGFLTKTTDQEQTKVILITQNELAKNAKDDVANLTLARERTKEFLERYILDIGEMLGEEYTIKFVN